MSQYYPSHAGYAVSQPVMQMGQPYEPYGMSAGYAPTGGMMYVPSHATSHHSRRRRHRHSYPSYGYGYNAYSGPQVVSALPTAVAPQMVMQPSYGYGYGYGHGYNPYSWGNRVRRFLGLGPSPNLQYQRDRATWGFMGYSRRQRYSDPNGNEVDRLGRPVIRIPN